MFTQPKGILSPDGYFYEVRTNVFALEKSTSDKDEN
jgi:hypothetical protein